MKRVVQIILLVLLCLILAALVFFRSHSGEKAPEPVPELTEAPVISEPTPEAPPDLTPEISVAPTPELTPEAGPEPSPEPGPYDDKPDIDITDWKYVLANTEHLLDRDFVPELKQLEYGHAFDSRAVDALNAFLQGARDEGLSVYLTSSYRGYAEQEYLFNRKVQQYGGDREAAARIVAIPGSSEHQTGLAADIVDQHYEYMNESLAETALSKWMYAHCAEYGFVLRFPEDKQEITGIMFEPWHFRYVGEEAAAYMMEKNLCLEEFVALYE